MKRTKKIITLAMAAVLLVSTTVAVTVAYLKSTTEVVQNTFTVGKVAITLDEAQVDLYGTPSEKEETTDADGDKVVTWTPVDWEDAPRVTKNEYKLIPSHTYVKDPTVHVTAGSEESYIRMIVTISDLTDVKTVLGEDAATGYFLPQNFVEGWESGIWETTNVVDEDTTADTATYEFRYYKTVNTLDGKVLDLEPLFTHIRVPEGVNNDELLELEELQIDVVAHAIQADGFADEDAAWAAFDAAQ